MKTRSKFLAALTLATVASASFADGAYGNRYIGASLGFLSFDPETSEEASLNNVEARAGGFLNDYLAAELRASAGVVGDEIQDVDVDLVYSFGAYIRAGLPITEQIFPYLMFGVTRVDIDVDDGLDAGGSETDTSYGAGIDFNLHAMTVSAEYANYIDVDGSSIDGITVGISTSF